MEYMFHLPMEQYRARDVAIKIIRKKLEELLMRIIASI